MRLERLLRSFGLQPTCRSVELTFKGLGGSERTASWEYTFPLGIQGRNLLLVSAELDEPEESPPQEDQEVPLILGVPTQTALGMVLRWTNFTFDMETLGVLGVPFSLSSAQHPEVSILDFADPRDFDLEFRLEEGPGPAGAPPPSDRAPGTPPLGGRTRMPPQRRSAGWWKCSRGWIPAEAAPTVPLRC